MTDTTSIARRSDVAVTEKLPPDTDRVLIVDDDEDVLELTADSVRTLGYHVLTARNGPEAIAALRKGSGISVLFTDIQMPGMGGEELAEIAVALRPDIRVVFMSGFRRPSGDALFVAKPYRAADLIRVLPPQPLRSSRPDA